MFSKDMSFHNVSSHRKFYKSLTFVNECCSKDNLAHNSKSRSFYKMSKKRNYIFHINRASDIYNFIQLFSIE